MLQTFAAFRAFWVSLLKEFYSCQKNLAVYTSQIDHSWLKITLQIHGVT